MSYSVVPHLVSSGEPIVEPEFIAQRAYTEYHTCPEINHSFNTYSEYLEAIHEMVVDTDRIEYYIKDSQGVLVGVIIVQQYFDIHYKTLAAASVLLTMPYLRGDRQLAKLVVKCLKNAAEALGVRYYARTSKATPYVTKQIVKEI